MTTIDDFFEFIRTQDPDEPIDHSGWHCCAVGVFCDEFELNQDEFLELLQEQQGYIAECLNQGSDLNAEVDISTFGGLADLIEQYDGDDYDRDEY